MQTVRWENIISHKPGQLQEDGVYNLLIQKGNRIVDIRCRVIGINATTVLIFKLKDE